LRAELRKIHLLLGTWVNRDKEKDRGCSTPWPFQLL
jgi:hypothetical protein